MSSPNYRLHFLSFVFCLITTAVLARLFYWQILSGDRLTAAAAKQHWKNLSLPAPRGKILTQDGYPLVNNQTSYDLYLDRSQIKLPETEITSQVMPLISTDSAILASESARLQKQLQNPNSIWIKLFSRLTATIKNQIASLNISGLVFQNQPIRIYPEASQSAHLLGFVAANSAGQPQGYFGLEGFYDRELSGRSGSLSLETDAVGNPIVLGNSRQQASLPGRDLFTHLDRSIQFIAEQKLLAGLQKYGAVSGTVSIMDPQTGAILAMAAYPNYSPTDYSQYPREYYPNPIINQSYEPGSTFKVLIMAAALDQGVVNDQTICPCSGPKIINSFSISTWDGKYHPNSTITEIIQNSDNVGMVFTSELLGHDAIINYLQKFGFGKPTGIDLQEESSPALRKDWRPIDLATASFGQGIAVTPLQMLTAVASLANHGILTQPQIVDKLIDSSTQPETIIDISPHQIRQVVSATAASQMTKIMINAVKKGEAKWAAPKGYRIAGKTGTAQIPVAGHYEANKTIASFVGFAPADNPKFAMLVTLREPTTSPWGSETAAPLWFDIAKQLFLHWNIPPTN